jgi:hypothetical protein
MFALRAAMEEVGNEKQSGSLRYDLIDYDGLFAYSNASLTIYSSFSFQNIKRKEENQRGSIRKRPHETTINPKKLILFYIFFFCFSFSFLFPSSFPLQNGYSTTASSHAKR